MHPQIFHGAIMPPPRGLIQTLDQDLHRSALLPRRTKLLLAISGGADSVALLRLLHAINHSNHWHWTLHIAHVDHGIRGPASRADAAFVRTLAQSLALPCTIKHLRLKKNASEATARTARLAALRAIATSQKCDAFVMAHHADDQAETLLLRLMRGTGIDGLAAMKPASTLDGLTLFRPLLTLRRAQLRAHLTELHQPWREDETNHTDAYLRNRLRTILLPALEILAPTAIQAIGRTALLAGEAHELLATQTAALFQSALLKKTKTHLHFRRPLLQHSHRYLCAELLRSAITLLGGSTETADFERIREAVRIIQNPAGGKVVQMGDGIFIRVAAGSVIIERER
jgi:tRNA(Ile)-lysidine synthase